MTSVACQRDRLFSIIVLSASQCKKKKKKTTLSLLLKYFFFFLLFPWNSWQVVVLLISRWIFFNEKEKNKKRPWVERKEWRKEGRKEIGAPVISLLHRLLGDVLNGTSERHYFLLLKTEENRCCCLSGPPGSINLFIFPFVRYVKTLLVFLFFFPLPPPVVASWDQMQLTSLNQSDGRWVSVSSSALTSLAALASFSSSGVRGCWRLCCRFSTILSQHHADCAFQFLDCATFFTLPLCWRSPIRDKRHLPVSFEHLLPGCQAFPASL